LGSADGDEFHDWNGAESSGSRRVSESERLGNVPCSRMTSLRISDISLRGFGPLLAGWRPGRR
jgi:hypothetical protein